MDTISNQNHIQANLDVLKKTVDLFSIGAKSTNENMDSITSRLFQIFERQNDTIKISDFLQVIDECGIWRTDPRIKRSVKDLLEFQSSKGDNIDFDNFERICSVEISLIEQILCNDLIIPEFQAFKKEFHRIFEETKEINTGKVADYIPQLGKVDPSKFAVSFCSIDGQRFSIGDMNDFFCIQSCSKPINYCLAIEEHGLEKVKRHVGIEPSGESFNKLALNAEGLPHNPMVNAGGVMSTSLVKTGHSQADRFEFVSKIWSRLCGGARINFNNSVYLSERDTADRNFCLAYMMRESGAFPENATLLNTLELYFQCCSMETTCEDFAVLAATFANDGICPLTTDRVFKSDTVKNCLCLMYSCGLYDFSGSWSFDIGIPAKSGVGGSIFGVIPGVGGVCVWSPRLDKHGNSVRGVEFFKRLVQKFAFHHFENHSSHPSQSKLDPRKQAFASDLHELVSFLYACAEGDIQFIRKQFAKGFDVNTGDYDGRTGLHLAASEGKIAVVRFLLQRGARFDPVDRWGGTPLRDAIQGEHIEVEKFLRQYASDNSITIDN